MSKRTVLVAVGITLVLAAIIFFSRPSQTQDGFTRAMIRGNGYLENGDATNAVSTYLQAVRLAPESLDARLNLANAYLLAGESPGAIAQCQQAIALDHNSAAAYYLMGCAYLRQNQPEPAFQAFQQSEQIDPAVTALNFQLGLAQAALGHLPDAIGQFETVVRFEPEHPSAHYQLSQLYQREGRADDVARELQKHQEILAKRPPDASGPAAFERCKYTQPRIAFVLEQPDHRGISVHFVNATATAFAHASDYRAPLAVLDFNHDGRNSLFVREGDKGFRVLDNQNGRFEPLSEPLPGQAGAVYRRALVGDVNNDRFEDVIVLGEQASHAFKFATNGQVREITSFAGLKNLKARDGLLADLDFTGRLDLLAVSTDGSGLILYQNLGNFYFQNNTNAGLPASVNGAEQVAAEDWSNEDVPGVFVARTGKPPLFFPKQRAGSFVVTKTPSDWPSGGCLATGDLNNDLRTDLVVAGDRNLEIVFGGQTNRTRISLEGRQVKEILLVDYDNDGWLDLIAYGNGLRVWRNEGTRGFVEVTKDLGLDKISAVDALVAADFDNDGDTDLMLSGPSGLEFWRNDGGNANRQLKLRLVGNRSNASALGMRVELATGNWRAIRTLRQPPLEIGVGQYNKIDALRIRGFDTASSLVDVPVQTNQLTVDELTVPTGSCPYLYAWNGERFHFVTDILGAAPLGLPVSKTRYIEADPEEYLALGNENKFLPKAGHYEIRITEELREVLYLDGAKLVVVDHPPGTLVCPTSKLVPGRPFVPHELWTVRPFASLKQAVRSDGLDVTKALTQTDSEMVSPVRLREPQLRGLAEPFAVTMDFGELRSELPLVLVMTGWLRFGGGMANVAASLDPNLPFPFPTLEAESSDGLWTKVDVVVGAPSGKTKTILVDLEHKLPPGTRRLRLTTAFEIHWDSALLAEKVSAEKNHPAVLAPDQSDLHWRGFSQFMPLPDWLPLTPDYDRVQPNPPWRRTPSGWCTRYGPVDELTAKSDDALVLLNGGDELALSFKADRLPAKPAGYVRDFYLYVVGWDKDADFHVGQGWRVEPLPFRGMDDQKYDQQSSPASDEDWVKKYNTRWVGPMILSKRAE
ncbi:MAG: FG-GAP-like repeat-containing protein [Verrucomicrobiota bacterium]